LLVRSQKVDDDDRLNPSILFSAKMMTLKWQSSLQFQNILDYMTFLKTTK
jgi:hypothetical protein